METHVLTAIYPNGHRVEVGHVRSLELAARLRRVLANELGDEYFDFELKPAPEPETPAPRATVRSLTYDELRRGPERRRRARA